MNMYRAESICVHMCGVVCELSQTPLDHALCRLISAVHKDALCALQDTESQDNESTV